ncbi:MAG: TSUP family transporter, partial [Bdellovibrionales bacterium]|nr:TSUP family transporter [Bdellovibrionales bacterium]
LGALGGLLSGLFSSGGPAFAVYAISRYKTKEEIRANLIAILALTNVIRFFTLVLTGVLTWQTCIFALKLSPIFCIALLVGERLFFKMNVKVFLHVVMIFLVISGVNFVKPF